MVYVFGEILVWLLAALFLGGVLAVLWMRLVTGARGNQQLAPLNDQIAALESERDSLRRDVGEARDRSTERETQLSALRDDLEAHQAKIASQAAEIEKLRETGGSGRHAPAGDSATDALRVELEAIRQRIARRDLEVAELNAELANAREAYHHLEAAQFAVAVSIPTADAEAAPVEETEAELPADEARMPTQITAEATSARDAPADETSELRPQSETATPARADADADADQHDDLTRIRGIGKVLQNKLNALGVTSFAQIAAFTPEDVTRVGAGLTPKDRIQRDSWIAQARALLAEREAG